MSTLFFLRVAGCLSRVTSVNQVDHLDNPVGKAVLIVEPQDQFDCVFGQLTAGLGVDNHRVGLAHKERAGAVVLTHQHPVADDPSALGALCKLAQLQTNVSVNALALNLQLDRQVEHADIWGWLERTEGQESEFSLGALLLESLILDWQKMNIG